AKSEVGTDTVGKVTPGTDVGGTVVPGTVTGGTEEVVTDELPREPPFAPVTPACPAPPAPAGWPGKDGTWQLTSIGRQMGFTGIPRASKSCEAVGDVTLRRSRRWNFGSQAAARPLVLPVRSAPATSVGPD